MNVLRMPASAPMRKLVSSNKMLSANNFNSAKQLLSANKLLVLRDLGGREPPARILPPKKGQ